jgi:hypothetical protein
MLVVIPFLTDWIVLVSIGAAIGTGIIVAIALRYAKHAD